MSKTPPEQAMEMLKAIEQSPAADDPVVKDLLTKYAHRVANLAACIEVDKNGPFKQEWECELLSIMEEIISAVEAKIRTLQDLAKTQETGITYFDQFPNWEILTGEEKNAFRRLMDTYESAMAAVLKLLPGEKIYPLDNTIDNALLTMPITSLREIFRAMKEPSVVIVPPVQCEVIMDAIKNQGINIICEADVSYISPCGSFQIYIMEGEQWPWTYRRKHESVEEFKNKTIVELEKMAMGDTPLDAYLMLLYLRLLQASKYGTTDGLIDVHSIENDPRGTECLTHVPGQNEIYMAKLLYETRNLIIARPASDASQKGHTVIRPTRLHLFASPSQVISSNSLS